MSLSRTVVNRPTTILIAFVILVLFGLYTALNITIDLYPEITPPVLVISTSYQGAGPEEVEKTITRPLESTLGNVSNLNSITSTSAEGSSMLVLEFTYGTNMSEAANDVRDSLEFVRDILPDDASSPMIFKFNPSIIPILRLTIEGNRPQEELRKLAEDYIAPRLEQTTGVSMASVNGGRIPQVKVDIGIDRLEAYGLSMTQLANILRAQNIQLAGGRIVENDINYLVRTAGEYTSLDDIANTVISYKPVQSAAGMPKMIPIRLRDIADVYMGYSTVDTMVYVNGKPSVSISVLKQSGTNSVEVADRAKEKIQEIQKSLPPDVEIKITRDTTQIIRDSLSQVASSAISGAILAMLVLFFFLRSIKPTIIIGFAIPISVIISLAAIYFAGITLNIMTLTGLALGVGMLVDNSIVMLENIYRYREKGAKPHISAILGSEEMITAITASTLTTVAVFIPIAIFKNELEMIGEMFADLAFTIVISLISSMVVAFLLVPVLASRYLKLNSRREKPLGPTLSRLDRPFASFFEKLDKAYKSALTWTLRNKGKTILVISLLFILSLAAIPQIGFEFTPQEEPDSVTLSVELPLGSSVERTRDVLFQISAIVEDEVKGYKDIMITAGEGAFFGLGATSTHKGSILITLPEYSKRIDNAQTIQDKLRKHFEDFPGVAFEFSSGNQMGNPSGSSSPIDVLVKSDDLEIAKETAYKIEELIKTKLSDYIIDPQVDAEEGLPQVEVMINRQKAYSLGLNVYTIGQEIEAAIDGITAGKFRISGNEYDIHLGLPDRDRNKLETLDRIFVTSSTGERIPLSSIAEIKRSTGPTSITREDQTRTIHVTASLPMGVTVDKAEPLLREVILQEIPAKEGLTIEYGGDYKQLMEYMGKFVIIMLVAVMLVFGIMASQFESLLDPFIILFTIPLSVIGIVAVHLLTGTILSIYTAVGLVILVGIVVNNGIVLVDYTNLLRKRGMGLFEACVEAGKNRLRPVLMTALTTILGLAPIAFTQGEGMSLIQPIAKTVVGGLTVSTFLTLFLIPVIYYIFNRISDWFKSLFKEKENQRRARLLGEEA